MPRYICYVCKRLMRTTGTPKFTGKCGRCARLHPGARKNLEGAA